MNFAIDATLRFLGAHAELQEHLTRLKLYAQRAHLLTLAQQQRNAASLLNTLKVGISDHHRDEEMALFPPMLAAAAPGNESALVVSLINRLTREHRAIESAWNGLSKTLEGVQAGSQVLPDLALCSDLLDRYEQHAKFEETVVLPIAYRLLSAGAPLDRPDTAALRHRIDNLPGYI